MKLASQTNTRTMAKRILSAAHADLRQRPLQADFEHDQWWITNTRTGAQWAVIDASGPGTTDGFFFEMVTEATDA